MPEDDKLLGRADNFLQDRPWYSLPRLLAMPRLVEIRNELRAKNLHDTEEPPLVTGPIPANLDPNLRAHRTVAGDHNDLTTPQMGCAGRRFGRNVPLEHVFPDAANLMVPNPRVVSQELMTRDQFQPATILNLLAASWIQFMVHDWFVHKKTPVADGIEIPLPPGDPWPGGQLKVGRTVPDSAPAGSTRPPAYANQNSHWWDASQVYGCDIETCARLRSGVGGRLAMDAKDLLPIDPLSGIDSTGFTDNWWIGLSMLHTLFAREHNHICDLLAREHPGWNDSQLYETAKLINSAILAKIHTVEWTPAILPHSIIGTAMHTNWYGLVDQDLQDVLRFLNEDELLGGIIGSRANHHTAPYSLTEEFVSVYRMHPLIPDDLAFRSATTNALLETLPLPEVSGRRSRAVSDRISLPDLFYSFGVAHPGAIALHNYPKHLQNLTLENGERLDLAAVDILRDRERGVPRYNQFRRLINKPPVASIDAMTDNAAWRSEIKRVYGKDVEKVDLMTGLYAEPLPEGFGFSDTAFRIFVLMASRRLKSDRFFTDDYNAKTYTEFGINYIREATMIGLISRHLPEVRPALAGVENAFKPWKTLG